MYSTCILCGRRLGSNRVLDTLPVGRRIAFELTHGRLWVICTRCGAWNLTPLEDRWEALAECDRFFASAPLRSAEGDIGLAEAADGTQIIRIGKSASRSDIANWRYGKRLYRRRRRLMLLVGAAGLVTMGVMAAFGLGTHSILGTAYLTGALVAWIRALPGSFNWRVLARFRPAGSQPVLIREMDLPRVRVIRHPGTRLSLQVTDRGMKHVLEGNDAARVLTQLLPHLNWKSAPLEEIAQALQLVERAEARATARDHGGLAPWQRVPGIHTGTRLDRLSRPQLLALEMAVTEELELAALQGNAIRYAPAWREAEHIAAIADDLLLPEGVEERLGDLKKGARPGTPPAAGRSGN